MRSVVRFGCFQVDLAAGEVRKHGIRIHLREQCFQVLATLLEHPGEVVTRESLRRRLWSDDVIVDFDNSLNSAVASLRETLGDSAERPRFLETLPKRGYRFLAQVSDDVPVPEPRGAPRTRVVVLPFVNLTGDPEQEYFSDAITDEVMTELAALAPDLGVIARTSARRYKGTHKDVARIGRELGVHHIVDGGVHRDGNRVGITVQVVRVSDRTHVLARRYEADLHHVFELRSSIAEAIASCVTSPASDRHAGASPADPRRRSRPPTQDLAAYNEYIRGRYILERANPEAIARATQHFENAIARDPGFALAHDALAELYSYLGYLGYVRPKDAFSVGISHALAAVETDDTLAEAHAVLAEYHKQLDYNWRAAEHQITRALGLNDSSPTVRLRHAVAVLMPQGRIDEAIGEIERALDWDPLSPMVQAWLGILLLLGRQYDRAIREAERLLEIEPESCWPFFIMGCAYRQKYVEPAAGEPGHLDLAGASIRSLRKAVELSSGSTIFHGWLGHALAVFGSKAEARAVLQRLHQSTRYVLPTGFGFVHLGLEEPDAAFDWFDRAVEERDQTIMPILSYPPFDSIREDPRYTALLRKMKLQ